ncbi:3-isopropylmalate dehydratase [Spongiibacter sp. KMU-166]|uniref:3-isopropylmalate dehydratase n=1 Tax=Spongiibacter thalassae TaxID=2721624 RepID=A0ABX1GBG2_9GAMM|nr:3-isopropylmalate dehydratase [Spongiibacter thalassae]NKI15938.1 3-isopropylmalate dehydratase [Spongiibacter thalassae]
MESLKGRAAYVFGDNYDIDLIIGIENISISDTDKIVDVLMYKYDSEFKSNINVGDILVGGKNFGYGHPHPQAMVGMRAVGIDVIVAESYAFPFYRSELASGMKLLECADISTNVSRWDELDIDVHQGLLRNITQGTEFKLKEVTPIALDMMTAGGVEGYLKKR